MDVQYIIVQRCICEVSREIAALEQLLPYVHDERGPVYAVMRANLVDMLDNLQTSADELRD